MDTFQLEPTLELNSDIFAHYNIKPKDVLYIFPISELRQMCNHLNISTRGKNIVTQIINHYIESEDIFIENYSLLAGNDITALKNNGINIKSEESGSKFEEVTKSILNKMGLNVNEELRAKINTNKEKADIIIDLGNNDIYIIECKASKNEYNKFSNTTRQISSYVNFYKKQNYNIKGAILIANTFSEDFKNSVDTFTDYQLTLIEAETLYNVFETFKQNKTKTFPHGLFRHNLMDEGVTIKALSK